MQISNDAKRAILNCLQNAAWANGNAQTYYDALADAFFPVTSISAVYTQGGTVTESTPLDDLKSDLVVTATYEGGTTEIVPSDGYTLSGTLETGTSTVTVTYASKSATFTVNVTSSTYVTSGLTHHWDGIDNTGSGHDASATTWKDLVGSLDITTITGGTWDTNGLTFSGANTQRAYASSNIETTANTTIEMVFKTTATGTQMIGSFDIYSGTISKRFSIFSDNTIKFVGDPGYTFSNTGSSLTGINSATAVYSNFTVSKAFINATELSLSNKTHSFKRSTGNNFVLFGNVDSGDSTKYPFTGKLMAVRVYDRALTAEEIAQNYAVDVARFSL